MSEYETSQTLAEDFYDILGTDGRALSVEELARLAAARPVTEQDILHLRQQYPFIDVCNADIATIPELSTKAELRRMQCGWLLYDRGARLTMGVGRLQYGRFQASNSAQKGDDDQGGQSGIRPIGTLIQQMFDSAFEIIGEAKARWPAVHIIHGTDAMRSLAWMAAEQYDFSINHEPSAVDRETFSLVKQHARAYGRSFRPR